MIGIVKSFFFLIREENQDVKKLSRKVLATICVIYQRDKVKRRKKKYPVKREGTRESRGRKHFHCDSTQN